MKEPERKEIGGLQAARMYQNIRSRSAELRRVLSQPIAAFENMGETVWKGEGKNAGRTIYINRGSPILGVAHLDSVQNFKGMWLNGRYLAASTIDNRLGAWLMLYGLPAIGIKPDVLLTEDEEMGMSTAANFEKARDYNWAFSFDRTGDDVACYQYHNTEVSNAMLDYELRATYGSYSDVADLEIGARGFNFGCGMYAYHSQDAYCNLDELCRNVGRFSAWYEDMRTTKWEYDNTRDTKWRETYYYGGTRDSALYSMTDKEWDDYMNSYVKCTDGVWRREDDAIRRGLYTKTTAIAKTAAWESTETIWDREARMDLVRFLDGELTPLDWQEVHMLASDNRGKAGVCVCEGCKELYHWSDTAWVRSYSVNLCKGCFAWWILNDEPLTVE